MATQEDQMMCALCGEWFDKEQMEKAHIIPRARTGDRCSCPANLIWACRDCNRGPDGQFELTPLEYWAKQQWEGEWENSRKEPAGSMFDAGGWTLEERQRVLLLAAYWEARARWHLKNEHGIEANFWAD